MKVYVVRVILLITFLRQIHAIILLVFILSNILKMMVQSKVVFDQLNRSTARRENSSFFVDGIAEVRPNDT